MNMNEWADIVDEIFLCICRRLTYVEIIIASAVCKSWQSLGSSFLEGIQSPPKSPWLMLPEKKDDSEHSIVRQFYDLSSGKIVNLNLPHTINRKCISVGFGWLLTLDMDLQMNLLHPLTGRQINLPHYTTFKQYNPERKYLGVHGILLWKAVASADPWNYEIHDFNQDCVIMATYEEGLPAIVKLGDEVWTDIQTEGGYCAIVYYRSQFYIIDSQGFLYVCNVNGDQVTCIAHYKWDHLGLNNYLVESADELLLVCRKYGGETFERPPLEIPFATTSFEVCKLIKKNDEYEFIKVGTFGNQALFLGDGASFSLSATSMNGCRSDCIYFTEECLEFLAAEHGDSYDMGVYHLRDGSIKQHYKGDSPYYLSSTPFWYI